jgi:histone H3/H4
MDEFTKSSILKLARKAGIKSLSEDTYNTIRNLIGLKIDKTISDVLILNSERKTKTILMDDLIDSYALKNKFISKSTELNK